MKKIFSLFATFILVLAMVVAAGGFTAVSADPPAPSLSLDAPAETHPGSVTVKVMVSDVVNLDAANYDLQFDPALLQFSAAGPGSIAGTAIPIDMRDMVAPGKIRVIQNLAGLTGVSGSGVLTIFTFQTKGEGTAAISLSNGALSNILAEEIPVTWNIGASIIIIPFATGDANQDGAVNALDITALEMIIMGSKPPVAPADANGDGKFNVLDITKVERIIAGL